MSEVCDNETICRQFDESSSECSFEKIGTQCCDETVEM